MFQINKIKLGVILVVALIATNSCKKENAILNGQYLIKGQKSLDVVILTEEESNDILVYSMTESELPSMKYQMMERMQNFGEYVVLAFDNSQQRFKMGTVNQSQHETCYERLTGYFYMLWDTLQDLPIMAYFESSDFDSVYNWMTAEAKAGFKSCMGYDERDGKYYAFSDRETAPPPVNDDPPCISCGSSPFISCKDGFDYCYLCKGADFTYENIVSQDEFDDAFSLIIENLKYSTLGKIAIMTFNETGQYFQYDFVSNDRYTDLFDILSTFLDNEDGDFPCTGTLVTKNEDELKKWVKAEIRKGLEVCTKYDGKTKTWTATSSLVEIRP